ncbi:MAG: gamma-glutamyl-gamma-aminobutyrate hydrolase family protein [Pseudoflavonifractor sp.]
MNPRILIAGSKGDQRARYDSAVTAAGGIPFSFYCPAADGSYDGLLLCGGDDIDPHRYGQDNRGSHGTDPDRDGAELALIEVYLAAKKPILAICRGHQLMNVALGGTLIQDLPPEARIFHTSGEDANYDRVHPVRSASGSVLGNLYGSLFAVNSHHHQVVDHLGQDLRVTLRSESGIIEGMEHKTLPVLCVQFHPERMTGDDTVSGSDIFSWFIGICSGK